MDFWAIREGMTLRPFGAESATVFGRLPFGKVCQVVVRQPRNGAHHRLYWALCSRIADAVGADAEDISDLLKVRTGYVRQIKTKHGVEEFPKSISFAAMDQTAFKDFFDKCVTVIYSELGIARPDVVEAVKDLLSEAA